MSETIKSTVRTDQPRVGKSEINLVETGGFLRKMLGFGANVVETGVQLSILPPVVGLGVKLLRNLIEPNQYVLKPINEQVPVNNTSFMKLPVNPLHETFKDDLKDCKKCTMLCRKRKRGKGIINFMCKQCEMKCIPTS